MQKGIGLEPELAQIDGGLVKVTCLYFGGEQTEGTEQDVTQARKIDRPTEHTNALSGSPRLT